MNKHHNTLLCLGDSYTIGESVPLHDNFPYQLVQLLRKEGYYFNAPEIVAATGWTTFELAEHILHTHLNPPYDFVTLLIGVNNQYRGLSITDFKSDLEFLVKKAIHFAHEESKHVIMLSIPDWGVTPFAKDRDTAAISKEIDQYNTICESTAQLHQVQYINITEDTRKAKDDISLLAKDQLHYAAKEHAIWAEKIRDVIRKTLLQKNINS
jgi:lysophospholipase L1-like esterase